MLMAAGDENKKAQL